MELDTWLSPKQAAELMGVGLHSARRLMRDGYLVVRRIPGTCPRISRASCLELIRKYMTVAGAESASI